MELDKYYKVQSIYVASNKLNSADSCSCLCNFYKMWFKKLCRTERKFKLTAITIKLALRQHGLSGLLLYSYSKKCGHLLCTWDPELFSVIFYGCIFITRWLCLGGHCPTFSCTAGRRVTMALSCGWDPVNRWFQLQICQSPPSRGDGRNMPVA